MYAALVIGEPPAAGGAGGRPAPDDPGEALVSTAREFSPRVERVSQRAVVCDVAGLDRLFGDARAVGSELRREAADRGVAVRVAVAPTRGAALLTAHAQPGITIVAPGEEAALLALLPVRTLDAVCGGDSPAVALSPPVPTARFYRTSPMQELARARGRQRPCAGAEAAEARARYDAMIEILARWGVRTLGELAALPPAQLSARLGQPGVRLQRLARGEDVGPLVPLVPEDIFEARLDLEWPIEGLEPLSFVLGRLLEPVCAHLERRGRAAAVLTTTLRLVSRDTHERSLQLPAAMRDPRVLRTLALLDLESHPPAAGIDAVAVRVEPTPGRVLQFSLLERALPAPEQLSTLLARLSALMGQGRCGSARLLDTHRPGAFAMAAFAVEHAPPPLTPATATDDSVASRDRSTDTAVVSAAPALRRFRHPVPIRVQADLARPTRVMSDRAGIPGGRIEMAAGPWRSSGDWWAVEAWNRDEWDVALEDGMLCRIYRDRDGRGWFMEGCWD
jgi:protein ImuB